MAGEGRGTEGVAYPGDAAVIEFGVEDAKVEAEAAKTCAVIEADGVVRCKT